LRCGLGNEDHEAGLAAGDMSKYGRNIVAIYGNCKYYAHKEAPKAQISRTCLERFVLLCGIKET
jgi:hypothetical protein